MSESGTASAFEATGTWRTPDIESLSSWATESESDEETAQNDLIEREACVPYDAQRCLFCNAMSASPDSNLDHMAKRHGLQIPQENLAVEPETLLEYMHLVIFGYFECLHCGSIRGSAQAAQQHMVGKGHCRINLSPGSEFLDFYEEVEEIPANVVVDGALRLPNGKVLGSRGQDNDKSRGSKTQTKALAVTAKQGTGPGGRLARKEIVFQKQVANMRDSDKAYLARFTTGQQRVVVQRAQREVARFRYQRFMLELKTQLRANKVKGGKR